MHGACILFILTSIFREIVIKKRITATTATVAPSHAVGQEKIQIKSFFEDNDNALFVADNVDVESIRVN